MCIASGLFLMTRIEPLIHIKNMYVIKEIFEITWSYEETKDALMADLYHFFRIPGFDTREDFIISWKKRKLCDEKKIHVPFGRDDVKELSDHPIIKKDT